MKEKEYINWAGYEWLTHEVWGRAKYSQPHQWMDSTCVIVRDDNLQLVTKYSPTTLEVMNPNTQQAETIRPKIGIGLVSCQYPFHFGEYEIEVKMPEGKDLWPAIWLYSLESWPPEIDIMEGYTNHRKSYWRWNMPPYSLKSNFHYRDEGLKEIGAKNIWVGFRNPAKRFIKFTMRWTPDEIKIGAGNWWSRRISISGDIMKHYQQPMRFLLNNGTTADHPVGSPISIFEIKSFKYIPYGKTK